MRCDGQFKLIFEKVEAKLGIKMNAQMLRITFLKQKEMTEQFRRQCKWDFTEHHMNVSQEQ